MKSKSTSSLFTTLVMSFAIHGTVHAASLSYDADIATPGAQDGSGLGWNLTDANLWDGAANVVWPNTTADEITFGAGSGAAGPVTVGTVNANKITFAAAGSGIYTLNGGTITLGGTTPTLAVNVDSAIASTLSGAAGLITSGSGGLTLSGAQTYNGAITLANNSVTFSGSSASTATNNALLIGGATGRTAVNFNSTGSFTYGTSAGNVRIGGNDGSGDPGAGAVAQSSGNVTMARNSTYLELGTNTGATPTSYGSYLLTGGTLTTPAGGGARIGNGGIGVFTQTGGTANIGRWFVLGGSTGAAAASNGVATLTGGSLTVNSGYRTLFGDRQNSSGTLNIGTLAGGTATMTNANASGITLLNTATALSATVNLNSGTLVLGGAITRNGTNVGSAAIVNLNGATLRPNVNNVKLIANANGLTANVYNGGLKVDTQSLDATIEAPLVNATGNGIYPAGGLVNMASPSGAGYLGAPVVTVTSSGTGIGATAVANVSNGQVTGVTLTCPGQGYLTGDSVTFAFDGGGATAAAPPFAHVLTAGELAANGTGGLSKLGSGRLTLMGATTFGGPVSVTGSLVSDNLTLNNTALSIHNFTPSLTTAPVIANTGFNTGGSIPVQVDGTFSQGVWPLIFYPVGGSIGGSGFSALQLQTGSFPRGVVATLQDNPSNGSVDLNVSGFNPLTWKGTTNAVWDINTTANWKIGATTEKYLNGDLVLFNDTATGSTSVTLDTTVAPQSVIFDNGSKNYTLSGTGTIGGTGTLSKTGNGTVTFLTANTYTGSTTVSGGTLQLGNGTSNGSIAGPLVNNATVIFNPAGTSPAASGDLAGEGFGEWVKTGSGTQVLTNSSNTSVGSFGIGQGTLQFGNGSVNGAPGNMFYEIAAGASLRFENASAATPPWSDIVGEGNIVLNTAQAINGSADWGSLAISGSYTGKLRVERGRVGANSGSFALGGTTKIEILPGAQFLAFTSTTPYITPIEIAGNGWGETGYPGGLRLAGGATATWESSVTLTADSGIMAQRTSSFTVTGSITGAFQCEFYAGDPAGDSGTLIVAPAAPVRNSYASTRINGRPNGSIVAGNGLAFSTGPLIVDSAILKLDGHDTAFANLSGAGGAIGNYSTSTPAVLTVGSDGTTTSFAGVLRDGDVAPLSFAKTGAGVLTLTAAQTYSGDTTVNQGRLVLPSSTFADTSTVTIKNGAVMEIITATSDTVGTLVLGGTMVGPGTYNSNTPTYGVYFAGEGSLVVGGAYEAWATSMGLDGTPGKENGLADDPDHDGSSNLTEFYMNGNPLASDPSILPAETLDATYLILTFKRRDDAEASVTTDAVQYGASLASWTSVAIGAETSTNANGVIVTVQENGAAADDITVQIPRTLAVGGKLFSRLQVTK